MSGDKPFYDPSKRVTFSITGAGETRGEIGEQIRLQGVQQGVSASEGNQSGIDKVIPQQGWSPDRGSAPAGAERRGETDPDHPLNSSMDSFSFRKNFLTPFGECNIPILGPTDCTNPSLLIFNLWL